MSALTKVFVVLLVVVSLLFVSGVVVFVNKVENFAQDATKARQDLASEKAARQALNMKLVQVQGEASKAAVEAADRANVFLTANQQLQSKVNDLTGEVAKRDANIGELQTAMNTTAKALETNQQANAALDKANGDLRTQIEDLERRLTQAQVAASDLNNRLDASNQQVRYNKEQIAALEKELQAAREQLAKLGPARGNAPAAPGTPGTTPAPSAPSGGPAVSTPNIRGVVRSKFRVGDVDYATVGLGSADGVTKGTKFNVIDAAGNRFLGYLTVDSVMPNESSGHLSGPNIQAIQQGSPVMTSWQ